MQSSELNARLRRAQRLATLTKHAEQFVQSLNYVVHSIKQLRVDRQKATMISPALGSIYETFIELLCESVKFILPNVRFILENGPAMAIHTMACLLAVLDGEGQCTFGLARGNRRFSLVIPCAKIKAHRARGKGHHIHELF